MTSAHSGSLQGGRFRLTGVLVVLACLLANTGRAQDGSQPMTKEPVDTLVYAFLTTLDSSLAKLFLVERRVPTRIYCTTEQCLSVYQAAYRKYKEAAAARPEPEPVAAEAVTGVAGSLTDGDPATDGVTNAVEQTSTDGSGEMKPDDVQQNGAAPDTRPGERRRKNKRNKKK